MAVAAPGSAGSPLPSPPPPFRITDFSHNRIARTGNATFLSEPCVEFLGEGMTAEGNAIANDARNRILSAVEAVQSGGIPPAALVAAKAVLGTGPEAGFGQSRREWRESEARRQRGILTEAAEGINLPGESVADEGEHKVHFEPSDGLAHQATNNARFGFVLDQDEFDAPRRLSPKAGTAIGVPVEDRTPKRRFW